MSAAPSEQDLKLEADARSVEDLVGLVRRGRVRIPSFQRGLRWKSEDVLALFDSVYRGYPVGALLLRKGPALAERLKLGPLQIDAPETREALWVVDGQQRLVALSAGLSRPRPLPKTPDDPWVVYFDAKARKFQAATKVGVPDSWVPVNELLDASRLSEWVYHWRHHEDPALRTAVFEAGSRIRQYAIPAYVVETEDEEVLRDIFYRINKSGQGMRWDEVYDALFGRRGEWPSTLAELAQDLRALGMGQPEQEQLLSCVMAFKGLDVTRTLSEHHRKNPEALEEGVQQALPALRRVLSFFRSHAEIPHLRLLPRSIPLVVLTRFFGLHPEPGKRTLYLLVRWTWRLLLSLNSFDERTLLRRGVDAIVPEDEEASVQNLLALVPKVHRVPFNLPERFDARAAESRLSLLGLASLGPRRLHDGGPVDVADWVEDEGSDAFRRIFPQEGRIGSSPANRILLPGSGSAHRVLADAFVHGVDSELFQSHGLTPVAMAALERRDAETFMRERISTLEDAVRQLGDRLAAWSRSDRPSISYVLDLAGAG